MSYLAAALIAAGLLAYAEVVRPDQLAGSYEARLNSASASLQGCFKKLDATRSQRLFQAPDIALSQKRQDVRAIQQAVQQCTAQLQHFHGDSQMLQRLPLSGFTDRYRTARVDQQRALDTAGQSQDVLQQYGQLADFLDQYYAGLAPFESYVAQLDGLDNLNVLYGQVADVAAHGRDLHAQAARIRALQAYPGFEGVIQPTAAMLDKAAVGFDHLSMGYGSYDDDTISLGFSEIEGATADYDNTVKNLPFDALSACYAVKQVGGLANKVSDIHLQETE